MAQHVPPFRVSHVIFDVDGTLIDLGGAMREAGRALASVIGETLGTAVSAPDVQMMRERVVAEAAWRTRTAVDQREETIRRMLAPGGASALARLPEIMRRYYAVRDEHLRPYDDVEPTLAELYQRGFTLVAATNGSVDLGQLAFSRYLHGWHLAQDGGVSKPDPRFFAHVLERFEATAERTLAIGDRMDNDVDPARAAGITAVLLDRAATATSVDVPRVERLTALVSLLERA